MIPINASPESDLVCGDGSCVKYSQIFYTSIESANYRANIFRHKKYNSFKYKCDGLSNQKIIRNISICITRTVHIILLCIDM